MEQYSWEGNLQWFYEYSTETLHQHHDVEPLPNGNVLILAWEQKTREEAIAAGRDPDRLDLDGIWLEHIVELRPVGAGPAEIVWEWNAWDHLIQDYDPERDHFGIVRDHPERIDFNFRNDFGGEDWLHANSIAYNAELDQIAISIRNWDEFWIIDHSTSTEEAAASTGGRWGKGGDLLYRWGNPFTYDRGTMEDRRLFGQHSVYWIEADRPDGGKLMVFNNGRSRPEGDFSTVEIIAPPVDAEGRYLLAPGESYGPEAPDWSYGDSESERFFSARISGAQRLPNGNTLICSGTNGRFFEVGPDRQQVWEYINPVRQGGPIPQGYPIAGNAAFRVTRYPADYPAFEDRDLTPGAPIELNPLDYDCTIYASNPSTVTNEVAAWTGLRLFPNPTRGQLWVEWDEAVELSLRIFDGTGREYHAERMGASPRFIATDTWPPGLYCLELRAADGRRSVQKIIVH
ncbi:MAG: aryl-sulfate sulfotransferase [Bacteroidota bacterium]